MDSDRLPVLWYLSTDNCHAINFEKPRTPGDSSLSRNLANVIRSRLACSSLDTENLFISTSKLLGTSSTLCTTQQRSAHIASIPYQDLYSDLVTQEAPSIDLSY